MHSTTSPLVSIIVPCYNSAAWIAETLESALAQTWPSKEIIVVNDGSTDNSLKVIRSMEQRGLTVVSQNNCGLSGARNAGLRAASGDYIQFLDADDLLSADKIEAQVASLINSPAGTLGISRWARFRQDHTRALFGQSALWRDFNSIDYLALSSRTGCFVPVHAWLIPRQIVDAIGPFSEELRTMEDIEYFNRAVMASSGIRFCKDGVSFYRSFHTQSMSKSRSFQSASSMLRSVSLVEDRLRSHFESPVLRQVVADHYQRLAYTLYPDHLELVEAAEKRAQSLGGSQIRLPMGRVARMLSRVVGWRAVQRLRALLWGMGIYIGKKNYVSD